MKMFLFGVGMTLVGIAVALGIGFLIVEAGGFPMAATTKPPGIEAWLGNMSVDAWVKSHAPHENNPYPANTEDLKDGAEMYVRHCAMCHGDAQNPTSKMNGGVYPRLPQFMQRTPPDPDANLFYVVKHGIRFTGMPAWGKVMSDQGIWKVVTFLKHMRDLPPDVQQDFQQLSARPGGD